MDRLALGEVMVVQVVLRPRQRLSDPLRLLLELDMRLVRTWASPTVVDLQDHRVIIIRITPVIITHPLLQVGVTMGHRLILPLVQVLQGTDTSQTGIDVMAPVDLVDREGKGSMWTGDEAIRSLSNKNQANPMCVCPRPLM